MAEWLCSGLQSRLRRFDSGFSLHVLKKAININNLIRGEYNELTDREKEQNVSFVIEGVKK